MPALLWLRRDLRLGDLPALGAAHDAGGGDGVLACFVLDPVLWQGCGSMRRGWLAATLQATREIYGGSLVLRVGPPDRVLTALAAEIGATRVFCSAESTPYGRRRDTATAQRLEGVGARLSAVGSSYAVGPGLVVTGSGRPYQVFTPFARAWRAHGWPAPAPVPARLRLRECDSDPHGWHLVEQAAAEGTRTGAGEQAAMRRWRRFLEEDLAGYAEQRDRPDLDVTSRMSAHLKIGAVHPRTLLADLARRRCECAPAEAASIDRFVTELGWREFYADVLWHRPHTATADLRPLGLDYDPVGEQVQAWKLGRTGFPIVDAGMRQLLAEGWMHNRVRMITASFLTKDLHIWWPVGARHFARHLIDYDVASNSHGWQWVSGTGTDAAPYFRVFNPLRQGLACDPDGDYVRRWVPELRHLAGAAAHQPWTRPDGYRHGYPEPIVDHVEERAEALRRYQRARQ